MGSRQPGAPRFGTDGVRGVANVELTAEFALALGRAVARVLYLPGDPRRCVVGRDTRRSGPLLQAAFAAGLASEGIDVVDVGVLPTPGVASTCRRTGVPGAVISASHNPFADNGIKVFGPGGRKLGTAVEAAIEEALAQLLAGGAAASPARRGAEVGAIALDPGALTAYRAELVEALEGRRLEGIRVVLDAGNGAAAVTAAATFEAAGAEVVGLIGAEPDGTNINDGCGSTDPAHLAATVAEAGAVLGLAFDGDADRVIATDEAGEVIDGDRLLALFATDLAERGRLAGDTLVVTVMSNLGLHRAMADAGIAVTVTPVGDRAVLEALEGGGWSLGGEQSGHLIFRDLATTGDGVLSGLLLADLVRRRGAPLSMLAAGAMVRLPQVLRNVVVGAREGLADAGAVWDEVRAVEAELGESGRVLLRPSGTEPVVRVMVEAGSLAVATEATERIASALVRTLGQP